MKQRLRLFAFFFFTTSSISAQIYEQWCAYPGFNSGANEFVVDYSNNTIYVAATVDYSPTSDIVVLAYNSNGSTKWTFIYNDSVWGNAQSKAIALDTFGNIYITGQVSGYNSSPGDIITMKLDTTGNLVWNKRYNGSQNLHDYSEDLVVNLAGDVFITGYANGPGTTKDLLLVKYNSMGILQWSHEINGNGNGSDRGQYLVAASDQNVVVAGYITDSINYTSILISKYDSLGNIIWDRRYTNAGFASMEIDSNDCLYFAGSYLDSSFNQYYAVHKFNSNGNLLWVARNDYGTAWENAKSVLIGTDGYIYSTGSYDCGAGCSSNIVTMKLDSSGNILWDMIYDTLAGSDAGEDLGVDENGNVYVVGTTHGISVSVQNITILKYDSTGVLTTETRESSYGVGKQIIVNASNDILVLGTCDRNSGWEHATVLHYSDTISTVAVQEHASMHSIMCYPNPSSGIFNMQTNIPIKTLSVYNLQGQAILSDSNSNYIDLSEQPSGCYFAITLLSDGSVHVVRLIRTEN